MQRIYQARDLVQAQLIVNMLAQQWIPAKIENAHQAGGLGELAVSYPEVWLKRTQDYLRARKVIDNFEAQSRTITDDLVCANCAELNPDNFDWCWACQADLA